MFSSNRSKLELVNSELQKQTDIIDKQLQQNNFEMAKLFQKGKDNLGARYINQWSQVIMEEKASLIAISVGSAGSEIQQAPPYLLKAQMKTAILNIDPCADSKNKLNSKDVSIDFLPTALYFERYPKTYNALNELIKNAIATGKQVIFTFHTAPVDLLSFKDIIKTNKDALEKNFTVVSAYHDGQPVLIYNKAVVKLLLENNFKSIRPGLTAIFGDGVEKDKDTLNKILQKYSLLLTYGKFHPSLLSLTMNDVIKQPEVEAKLTGFI